MLLLNSISVGPFQCNCWVFACPRTGETAILDPGAEPGKILKIISGLSAEAKIPLKVKTLLHTHAHVDHVGATRPLREHFGKENPEPPPILLHRDDEPFYREIKKQGLYFGLHYDDPLPVDQYLEDEQEIRLGDLKITVLHTPGHSPGSVCFRLQANEAYQIPEVVFSGDTLFQGSVGRTDLWGGDSGSLLKNIKTRLFTLDDATRLYPGHGPESTVGIEKRENPFF